MIHIQYHTYGNSLAVYCRLSLFFIEVKQKYEKVQSNTNLQGEVVMISPDDLKYLAQSIAQLSNQHVQTYERVHQMILNENASRTNPSLRREGDQMPIPPERPVIDATRKLTHL